MRLLSCVDQVVFLQVGQLREVLIAGLTPEGTLSAVHSQMDLGTECQRLYIFCQIQERVVAGNS